MSNFFKKISKLKKSENGISFLFFAFYFLFFIVVILIILFGGSKNYMIKEYEKGSVTQFNTSLLLNKNFYFNYKIIIDGVVYDYYGKKLNDVESFKFNNNDYYRNNNDYFVNNGSWNECDNPYLFYELIDVDNMVNILGNSSFSSKDVGENGMINYRYLVSSNTINKLIYNIDSDFDEIPNDIDINVNNESGTVEIRYVYNSLCKLKSICNDSLIIETNYEMINSVKDITNPIK